MLISKEKRAFWLFLLWVLILPVIHHPGLFAQDDDMFVVDDTASQSETASEDPEVDGPLPEEGEPGAADENAVFDNAGEGDDSVDSGDSEDDHPELPALSADPQELLAKVNGPARAGKHKDVIDALHEHEDAVGELPELLEIYIGALLNSDKIDWNQVNRLARQLSGKDPESSLGNYAQGMYHQNAKKPDLGKSLVFLGKAKAAAKPYPAAASAYYMALAKKYGIIVLLLVALPIVVVIKKKKAKKAALLDLDSLPDQVAAKDGEPDAAKTDAAANVKTAVDDKKADPKKKIKAKVRTTKEKIAETTSAKDDLAASVKEEDTEGETVEPAPSPVPPSAPAEKPVPPPASPAAVPVATGPALTAPPASATYQTITAKHQAEIEHLRELTRPGRRPAVQADPELDSLWGELSRKAMQGKIALQSRRDEPAAGGYRPGVSRPGSVGAASGGYPEPMAPDIDFNVSIDLSEESLKDDLTVKLKMMAISDGELREMFAQKNPRHIPHLIEYVLTKPEPVRLAFVARELGSFDDPAVIDVLAGLLYHEDQRVSLAAIQGLEITKKVVSIPHLCPFLKSDVPLLAQAARTALSNFGAVKIMQAFHNLPQNPDARVRSAGVFVMSRMKGAQVEELIKTMLHDDSLDIRCDVILAMSYQKNPVYIDSLREFFRIASDRDKTLARKAIVYLQGFVTRKK